MHNNLTTYLSSTIILQRQLKVKDILQCMIPHAALKRRNTSLFNVSANTQC